MIEGVDAVLSPEQHADRARELASPDAQPRLPDMVAVAVASWMPAGWVQAAAATTGSPRTAVFLYPDGLLVLRFDGSADDVRSAVVTYRDIRTIEMSHSSHWYFEYQHGGAESAVAWVDGATPASATIRFRCAVLDLGEELTFPLPGRERRYPGDWDLIRILRERVLDHANAGS